MNTDALLWVASFLVLGLTGASCDSPLSGTPADYDLGVVEDMRTVLAPPVQSGGGRASTSGNGSEPGGPGSQSSAARTLRGRWIIGWPDVFMDRFYRSQYALINRGLVRAVNSTAVKPNMAVLRQWLSRERQSLNLFNRPLVAALEQLVSLEDQMKRKRCVRDSYAVLYRNHRATVNRAHKAPSLLRPLRRVDALVYQFALKHSIDCFRQHPRNYAALRESALRPADRHAVESFMDALIGNPNAVERGEIRAVSGKRAAALAYSSISWHGAEDPDLRFLGPVVDERRGRPHIDSAAVRSLLQKYLVEPCRAFVAVFGPNVYQPAIFDLQMLEPEDRYRPNSRLMVRFLHSWLHYRLCNSLIKRDEPALAADLVEHIKGLLPSQASRQRADRSAPARQLQ